jgi:hypothetical protein
LAAFNPKPRQDRESLYRMAGLEGGGVGVGPGGAIEVDGAAGRCG